ncbi:hypothetical protein A2870_01780 [Candidatus Curtissbacteria bacterium RIFCSPHIGHO2_01_FULL_41_11]|uniref:Ribosomal protein n=1 Tax=Candidatus Curtissbacteria bacterium RIFCSPHIGHO2_01_FULL_41_11 TaxID=1797711 RepID=A0A1F5G572_9BACT|nr:MAG: hypothetical protein A2870_01780 [Candidatus Curtissbacteria bacterium RIFCSPHIGHO2_01_FULL_41_11]
MGTTRIKVIDLSSDQDKVKTKKRAEKPAGIPPEPETEKPQTEQTATTGEQQKSAQQSPAAKEVKSQPKKSQKVKKISTHHMGMNYLKATKSIDKNQNYSLSDAIDLLYKTSFTKFDPTVELHINVTDKNIKANVTFPHAVEAKAKEKKYLVFGDKKTDDSKNIIWADEKTIEHIESGRLKPKRDFDLVIAAPKYMPQLAKVAKILGPAGMMPNPKNQTITETPTKVIESSKESSGMDLRTDPTAPIIHTKIGKLSFKPAQIEENLKTLIFAIGPTKIQKITLKSTMSPPIKLDVSTIQK